MEFLFWLFVAHFVGDFALQTSFMSEYKSKLLWVMFAHCFIWTGVVLIPVKLFGFPITWQVVSFLFFVRFIIDMGKMWAFDFLEIILVNDEIDRAKKALFYLDQLCHVVQVVILWGIYSCF